MGSLQAFRQLSLQEVTSLNLLAVDDLKSNYRLDLSDVLTNADFGYLKAKKYLEAAHYSLIYYNGKAFFSYLKSGLRQQISIRFIKTYVILLRDYVLKKTGLLARNSKPPE